MSQMNGDYPTPEKKQKCINGVTMQHSACYSAATTEDILVAGSAKSLSSNEMSHKSNHHDKTCDGLTDQTISSCTLEDPEKSFCNRRSGNDCFNHGIQSTANINQVNWQCQKPATVVVSVCNNSHGPLCATSVYNAGNIGIINTSVGTTSQGPLFAMSADSFSQINSANIVQTTSVPVILSSDNQVNSSSSERTRLNGITVHLPSEDAGNKIILKNLLLEPVVELGSCTEILKQNNLTDQSHSQTSSQIPCPSHCTGKSLEVSNSTKKPELCESVSDHFAINNCRDGAGDTRVHSNSTDIVTSSGIQCRGQVAVNKASDLQTHQTEIDMIEKCHKVRPPLRKSQRRGKNSDSVVCPVCHVAVKLTDITEHLAVETCRLQKWAHDYSRKQARRHTTESSVPGTPGAEPSHKDRYQSFLRVKHHRQERHSGSSKRGGGSGSGTQCPVCNQHISGTQYQLNQHVEKCLQKDNAAIDVEGSSDSDGATEEGGYEEYEWAGQTRIRVTSMLPGNSLADAGFLVGQKCTEAEEMELDIEDDETDLYGQAQYNEADLIPCVADEPEEESGRQAIRDILLQQSQSPSSVPRSPHTTDKWSSEGLTEKVTMPSGTSSTSKPTDREVSPSECSCSDIPGTSKTQKNDAAKDGAAPTDKYRCLICMENYDSPATSIQCWHVYCEECWLRTLGAKKLCPQCNVITHPSDLRRIYL